MIIGQFMMALTIIVGMTFWFTFRYKRSKIFALKLGGPAGLFWALMTAFSIPIFILICIINPMLYPIGFYFAAFYFVYSIVCLTICVPVWQFYKMEPKDWRDYHKFGADKYLTRRQWPKYHMAYITWYYDDWKTGSARRNGMDFPEWLKFHKRKGDIHLETWWDAWKH